MAPPSRHGTQPRSRFGTQRLRRRRGRDDRTSGSGWLCLGLGGCISEDGGGGACADGVALAESIASLPAQICRSPSWDQGKEMAEHVQLTVEGVVQVYFCDPNSPWQRGSNENTNGPLRQYFPKRSDLDGLTQGHLDAVAAELNGRPRKTLGWMTPAEMFAELASAEG